MFTDRFRCLKIVFPILCIIGFVFYANVRGPLFYPGYKEARLSHQQFIGKSINFGGKIEEINQEYFLVRIDKQPVKIIGFIEKNKLNHLITGKAIYLEDGSLKLSQYHTSNIRIYKIFFSVFPILFIAYLFFNEYKFDRKIRLFVKIKN